MTVNIIFYAVACDIRKT